MRSNAELAKIYIDTQNASQNKFEKYKTEPSNIYNNNNINLHENKRFNRTVVEVINKDTLLACEDYLSDDTNICALNMASCFRAGGGVEKGSMAQEEELFRRTNYFMTLDRKFYPLNKPHVIYSPKVWVIKDERYIVFNNPFSVSFIAAAAIKNPLINSKGYIKSEDRQYMTDVIDNIFSCALSKGHDTLILGALGCGAYYNPQNEVIKIFNDALVKYDKCFKRIVFAVYSRRDDNFDLFNKYINRLNQ